MSRSSFPWKAWASRLQPFWEASAFTLAWGLFDVHSGLVDYPAGWPLYVFLAAAVVLGTRHAGRGAWMCWAPLGGGVYLLHRLAIVLGYEPPYVEKSATAARVTLSLFLAATPGLLLGLGIRTALWEFGMFHRRDEDEPPRIIPGTLRGLSVMIVWIAVVIAVVAWVLYDSGTVYAPGFDEDRFHQIAVGAPAEEVEQILGPPLARTPSGNRGIETWEYTEFTETTLGFWRRWIYIKDGNVSGVLSDYWYD